jgi:hypothetical protein
MAAIASSVGRPEIAAPVVGVIEIPGGSGHDRPAAAGADGVAGVDDRNPLLALGLVSRPVSTRRRARLRSALSVIAHRLHLIGRMIERGDGRMVRSGEPEGSRRMYGKPSMRGRVALRACRLAARRMPSRRLPRGTRIRPHPSIPATRPPHRPRNCEIGRDRIGEKYFLTERRVRRR